MSNGGSGGWWSCTGANCKLQVERSVVRAVSMELTLQSRVLSESGVRGGQRVRDFTHPTKEVIQ
jgi:hypothetical protein